MRRLSAALAALMLAFSLTATAADAPSVRINTSVGAITVALNPEKAPATVENFLTYVRDGFYNDTIFHRVIDGFMVQGGGFSSDFERKETREPVKNEADNGLHNGVGTIAMARTSDPHSATAQFFINVADNTFLNHTAPNPRGWGYCVFGEVTDGMQVVDAIRQTQTGRGGPFAGDVPNPLVIIESIEVIE